MRLHCTNCDTSHDDPSLAACPNCRMPDSLVVVDAPLPTELPTQPNSVGRLRCRNCYEPVLDESADRCPYCRSVHYLPPAHISRPPLGAAALRTQPTFFN
jgi:rubrerythrin